MNSAKKSKRSSPTGAATAPLAIEFYHADGYVAEDSVGYLSRRVRSQADRRVVHLELTTAGVQAAKGIPAVLSSVQNAHLAGFSVEEFETFKGFLRRILGNAQTPPSAQPTSGGPHEA